MSRKDQSRSLQWGSAYRNKAKSKLGTPHRSEGNDGDIQVRNTSLGARLFAKLSDRWLSSPLVGDDELSSGIVHPRAWYKTGTTDGSDEEPDTQTVVVLPEFINYESFLGFTFNISLGTNHHHGWSWDTLTANGNNGNRCEVSYNRSDNSIYMSYVGGDAQSKRYKLLVFFK